LGGGSVGGSKLNQLCSLGNVGSKDNAASVEEHACCFVLVVGMWPGGEYLVADGDKPAAVAKGTAKLVDDLVAAGVDGVEQPLSLGRAARLRLGECDLHSGQGCRGGRVGAQKLTIFRQRGGERCADEALCGAVVRKEERRHLKQAPGAAKDAGRGHQHQSSRIRQRLTCLSQWVSVAVVEIEAERVDVEVGLGSELLRQSRHRLAQSRQCLGQVVIICVHNKRLEESRWAINVRGGGRKGGRKEERKDGRKEGRKEGRTEERKEGRMDGRMEGWKEGRKDGWMEGRN
jgi:hypothetical protein